MLKRLLLILMALALFTGTASTAWAALAGVGEPLEPHGYPAYYQDASGLQLELCVPPPAGTATVESFCVFDPLDVGTPLVVAGETFWWMATALIDIPGGGQAGLTLGVEGTFGGAEQAIDGQQIAFGRTRIRIDTPSIGTYTVTHPYGTQVFEVTDTAAGINYTADIGSVNFLDPAAGFADTLFAFGPDQVSFLTWPDYRNNPALQVLAGAEVVEQYIGDPNVASPVVGGINGNAFRVEGPGGLLLETDQFFVMGKEYNPAIPRTSHTFPSAPAQQLAAIGPVNRAVDFGADGSVATIDPLFIEGGFVAEEDINYPLGYPLWYQDYSGMRLTICQGVEVGDIGATLPDLNLMCISDPIDPLAANYEAQLALRTGGETFYWSADAGIEIGDLVADLVLGQEGTFGGTEALVDGNQIGFGRLRIRIDTPEAGTYTVIHPYGINEFTGVPAGINAINFTGDIGMANLADPDHAFVGALFSSIGPNFLTWTTFDPTLLNNDPLLVKTEPALSPAGEPILDGNGVPVIKTVHYVGDPAVLHEVTGSVFEYEGEPVNYFRVIGPGGLDVRTDLFNVSGRVSPMPPAAATVSLLADPIDLATIGTPVVLTAAAGGGSGFYQYRFSVQAPGDAAATVVRDYATAATWTWDTAGLAEGIYQVSVDARNNGSTADAETSTTIQYTLVVPTPLNDDTAFITQTYVDILNREVDAAGLAFWVDQLAAGTTTRAAVVDFLLLSAEFDQAVAPVVRLALAYVLGPPDYGDLTFWIDAFATGMTLTSISDQFATSPGFTDMYGALSNEEFVTQVYLNVYQRQADPGGLAYWTGRLETNDLTRSQMMVAFATEAEYPALAANDVYVTMNYAGLLLRTPDQGGYNFWLGAMDQGLAGQNMLAFFLASDEYLARFNEPGPVLPE
ncbi:MAG: DUF4214 domain-containing protein [Desulfuromonadales bacterium]|nr:DUF4214 domain-containing protein [Desulfuromonadales bacterium]